MSCSGYVGALALGLGALACQDQLPPATGENGVPRRPVEVTSLSDSEGRTAAPTDHPGLPADHPPLPPDHPPLTLKSMPTPSSAEISGVIDVAPSVASKVKAGQIIFLVARHAITGRPLAVARLLAPEKFPLPFRLTSENAMLPGVDLKGQVRLMARADQDGDASSKSPGDVMGESNGMVSVPATDIVLTLSQVL